MQGVDFRVNQYDLKSNNKYQLAELEFINLAQP